jgi:hypothetical protein
LGFINIVAFYEATYPNFWGTVTTKHDSYLIAVPNKENMKEENTNKTGIGVGVGVAIGTAIFAATGNPVWIAIGVAIGAGIGAALNSASTNKKE